MTQAGLAAANADQTTADATDRVYRKVTLRLIPFLAALWILAWIDRVNVGFAKLQMLDDLHFSESVYGLGAGIFFLGYFLFEVPSNLLLERIGAKKTIARITIAWGLTCILMMFVRTPTQFYLVRFALGVFEAGFYPGIIFYLTFWYPTTRRARAFGMFMSASALAGVIGGPLAGTIMNGLGGVHGWAGWQWVFLLEGIPSILAGFVTLMYLTDRPEQARWLNDQDKQLLLQDLERDRATLDPRARKLLDVFRNPMVWLLIAIYFCVLCANSTLTFWAPTLVKEAGFKDPLVVGWIISACYLAGAVAMIWNGAHSDRSGEIRYHCALAALVGALGMVGVAWLLPIAPVAALVALAVAIVGTMGAIPVFWQLPNRFLSGTAAAAGIALINSVANLAGFGAPYATGLIKTTTGQFSIALLTVAAIEFIATVLLIMAVRRHQEN